ncbi:PIN domain-containing protein [Rhodoplanes serenus]|uniref:PIN domain-containing protein n=1 Tax=Rhodoplanes serenus TaxID=200615 RepID=A0A9X5AT05_9BRAD|nr:type II toxin-antitoxin system VapC family toxin [Rhodoplanes serenus]MTW16879.1 PIN domain-containing protein [Rhodoplanes serenus]
MADLSGPPLVYIDANPFIYFVEGTPEIAEPVRCLFDLLRGRPGLGVTSELSLAETLPKAPSERHRHSYLELIVGSRIFDLVPVDRDLLLETADYRRTNSSSDATGIRTMPKLPDAIHAVSAMRRKCRAFVSYDKRLKLPSGLRLFSPDTVSINELLKTIS